MKPPRHWACLALLLPAAFAQQVGAPTDDLDKLTVDELFRVQVTSVGRKAQELSKAPAAVFVITAEDIRRSGATSIPEALQWAPGLTVLQVNGRSWVVSARGDARLYADKMLVLQDGVSLYTPSFSGVMWDDISVPMEDIERIEVVLGPGAVMWGPNAVNGVINIISRSTDSTTGARVSQSNGNDVRDATEMSWGARAGEHLSYRIWGTYDSRTPGFGSPGYDLLLDNIPYRQDDIGRLDANSSSLGVRVEGSSGSDQWMVQGNLVRMRGQDPVAYPGHYPEAVDTVQGRSAYLGGSMQGVWTRSRAAGDESTLRFSFTRDNIDLPYLSTTVNNLTFDYQRRTQTDERNEVYWGVGYQQYWDATASSRFISFSPASGDYRSADVVLRDEYQLIPGRLTASAGARLDLNSISSLELQPSVRLLYTPNQIESAWIAVSRAVRVPSRVNRDLQYDGGSQLVEDVPVSMLFFGSKSVKSAVERSLEAGYRVQSAQRWSVSTSAFWSYYSRVIDEVAPSAPAVVLSGPVPSFTMPWVYANSGRGRTYGIEISAAWQVREGWRLLPSYSYLNEHRWLPADGSEMYAWETELSTVPHQFLLQSRHDLSRKLQLDLMARARSRDASQNLPGSVVLAARLGWRPTRSGELSIGVRDLADRRILETYSENPFMAIPLRRTYVIQWTQRVW